jgi:predicted secreted protein
MLTTSLRFATPTIDNYVADVEPSRQIGTASDALRIISRHDHRGAAMSRRLSIASVLLLLTVPFEAVADEAGLPAGATVLHLAERAERILPRDEVVAVLRVEMTGKTPPEVQAEVNRRMAAALEEAKKLATIRIETPSMSVYAIRDPKNGTMWTASESLQLRSKDFAAALALVGKLEDQGLAVSSLSFSISSDALTGVQDALTAEALQRLRTRAAAVAADLALAVDHIRTVTVGDAAAPGPQPRIMMAARAEAGASPPPAAEPGEAPVSVVVNAEVVLAPKH